MRNKNKSFLVKFFPCRFQSSLVLPGETRYIPVLFGGQTAGIHPLAAFHCSGKFLAQLVSFRSISESLHCPSSIASS